MFIYKAETELVKTGMKTNVAYFSTRIVGIAIVLLISYMSFHLYEKRFLRLKKKLTK
jgi:peptidoglycan/LPS O-acetylase OafA/YrhL